ncbi:MAG: YggT family protein [Alphaproteobacteria bacterium]|nr:YggT family protein [Alphaproteobacteria bacterium]
MGLFDIILGPLLTVIDMVLDLYVWVLIASVILSWLVAFNIVNTSNRFVYAVGDFLHRLTEPVLRRVRGILPAIGGVDLSPLIVIFGIMFLRMVIQRLAFALGV